MPEKQNNRPPESIQIPVRPSPELIKQAKDDLQTFRIRAAGFLSDPSMSEDKRKMITKMLIHPKLEEVQGWLKDNPLNPSVPQEDTETSK